MSPTQQQLTEMIAFLPEQDQQLILEMVKRFLRDDLATPDDLAAIQAARTEYREHKTTPHSAINWDT